MRAVGLFIFWHYFATVDDVRRVLEDAKFKSLKIAFSSHFSGPASGISPVSFKIFHQIQRSMAGATRHCGRQ